MRIVRNREGGLGAADWITMKAMLRATGKPNRPMRGERPPTANLEHHALGGTAAGGPRYSRSTIVAVACRFPGAPDPEAYWDLLSGGVDAIREIPEDRFDVDEYYDPDPEAPGKIYTRYGGYLESIDGFDPEFFGISPREAVWMDPGSANRRPDRALRCRPSRSSAAATARSRR